jgi:alanine racemase
MAEGAQPNPTRPTVLTVDLDAIAQNVSILSRHAGDRPLLAVVKSNAYGMGALPVARTLVEAGVRWLGVALVEEGAQLRRNGITLPILLLGPADPAQCPWLVELGITPAVYSLAFLEALEEAAAQAGRTVEAHLKVDSGMGRLGLREEEIPGFLSALAGAPHVRISGLFSNLASADNPSSPQTEDQLGRFLGILHTLRQSGVEPEWVHLSNSAGILAHPGTHLTLCRPGLSLYGMRPSDVLPEPGLKHALSLRTVVAQVKDLPPGTPVGYGATYRTASRQRVGILPIGYGDGLPRVLSPGGYALVGGARCSFLGRVSMDLAALDLEPYGGSEAGREVVLWGEGGGECLTPWDWARWAGTIPYEIMTGIRSRVARRYLKGGRAETVIPILS